MSDIRVKFEDGKALCSTACPRLTVANGKALSPCATTAQYGGYCGPWYRERVAELEADNKHLRDIVDVCWDACEDVVNISEDRRKIAPVACLVVDLAEKNERLMTDVRNLRAALVALLPGEACVTNRSVEAHLACGRWYLNVAGYVTAMETDICRDADLKGGSWTEEKIRKVEEVFNAPIRAALAAIQERTE